MISAPIRPDQRRHHRHDPPRRQPLAQKQRRAERHIDGREIVHRRDIRDRDARHGIEPARHPQRMRQPPRAEKRPRPPVEPYPQQLPQHR